MPRFSPHPVKSAIRLVRQSTTVPNTTNPSAFPAEISDMFAPLLLSLIGGPRSKHLAVLDESEIVGNLVVERPRLRVARLRQPIDAARIRRLGLLVDRLDQRPSQPSTPSSLCDKKIFQVAIAVRSPGRAMKQVVRDPHQFAVDITPQCEERFIRIMESLPGEIADLLRQRGFVERQIACP